MIKIPNLSITIIGHNEVDHLQELLPQLHFADEIIYVDCDSEDNSYTIAKSAGCKTYQRPNNPNLNVNKSFAFEQCSNDWIFYLDPDERLSYLLIEEISVKLKNPGKYSAFSMARKNFYFGKWLKYGSQYPDIQIRLFRKNLAYFPNLHVHEKLNVTGDIFKLQHDLLHYPYSSISQYLKKMDFYTTFEANYLLQKNKQSKFILFLTYCFVLPVTRFSRRFFLKGGFRDGWVGLFAAFFDTINLILRYFKFLELVHEKSKPKN